MLLRFSLPRWSGRRGRTSISQTSEKNIVRLIAAARIPRDRAIIEVFYATGCRASELLNIRLDDVDFKTRTIKVCGKNGSERRVVFGHVAKRCLLDSPRGRISGHLFLTQPRIQQGTVSQGKTAPAGYWLDYLKNKTPGRHETSTPPNILCPSGFPNLKVRFLELRFHAASPRSLRRCIHGPCRC